MRGNDGADGHKTLSQVKPSDFHSRSAADQRELAVAWGEYRAKRAEWLFRTASDDPTRTGQALAEAQASLGLQPAVFIELSPNPFNPFTGVIEAPKRQLFFPEAQSPAWQQAYRVRQLIWHNQTPIALPWDFDPSDGFAYYEDWALTFRDALSTPTGDRDLAGQWRLWDG